MSLLEKLGFDEAFDATSAETRRKLLMRLVLSGAVIGFSAAVSPWRLLAGWVVLIACAESLLWWSTSKSLMSRTRGLARSLRLLSSTLASSGWVLIAVCYWQTGVESMRLTAIALLAGVAMYLQKSCERTPIHLIACIIPPMIALIALPLTYASDVAHVVALESSMLLLVAFCIGSWADGYRSSLRLKAATAQIIAERETACAASRAKSAFLANMSHEIRTPLNGVVGVVDVLSGTKLDLEQRNMLEIVRASGATLERLLSDILDISRIEAGRVTIESQPFDLARAVRDVAAPSTMCAAEKGVVLQVEIAPEVEQRVMGDAARFKQILGNLLSNAVKFTEVGQVTVRAAAAGDRFIFSVTDTGVGFDAEQKARIFARFEQADGSITRKFGGSGLGLSISRQLAELMGGELDCEAVPNQGATFTLSLPLEALGPAAVAPEPATQPVQALNPAPADGDFRPMRVLLADDHAVNRKVVELMLASAGVELTSVEDGKAACEAFSSAAFDLVLMDMQMPVMDGLTAVRLIRAQEAVSGARTPIIMLTANALPEHVMAARLAGADEHLAKPISAASLLKVVAQAAAESGEARHAA